MNGTPGFENQSGESEKSPLGHVYARRPYYVMSQALSYLFCYPRQAQVLSIDVTLS
jgi:hypothetical protein